MDGIAPPPKKSSYNLDKINIPSFHNILLLNVVYSSAVGPRIFVKDYIND